eukprot:gene16561-19671_t
MSEMYLLLGGGWESGAEVQPDTAERKRVRKAARKQSVIINMLDTRAALPELEMLAEEAHAVPAQVDAGGCSVSPEPIELDGKTSHPRNSEEHFVGTATRSKYAAPTGKSTEARVSAAGQDSLARPLFRTALDKSMPQASAGNNMSWDTPVDLQPSGDKVLQLDCHEATVVLFKALQINTLRLQLCIPLEYLEEQARREFHDGAQRQRRLAQAIAQEQRLLCCSAMKSEAQARGTPGRTDQSRPSEDGEPTVKLIQQQQGWGKLRATRQLSVERMLGTAMVQAYLCTQALLSRNDLMKQLAMGMEAPWQMPSNRPFEWTVWRAMRRSSRALVRGARWLAKAHPLTAIVLVGPTQPFSRSERILVQANTYILMLTITVWFYYSKA